MFKRSLLSLSLLLVAATAVESSQQSQNEPIKIETATVDVQSGDKANISDPTVSTGSVTIGTNDSTQPAEDGQKTVAALKGAVEERISEHVSGKTAGDDAQGGFKNKLQNVVNKTTAEGRSYYESLKNGAQRGWTTTEELLKTGYDKSLGRVYQINDGTKVWVVRGVVAAAVLYAAYQLWKKYHAEVEETEEDLLRSQFSAASRNHAACNPRRK